MKLLGYQSAHVSYRHLLSLANGVLALSCLAFIATIVIGYPLSGYFSLPVLVVDHIGVVLLATVIKIAYVARCIAQEGLGLVVG